MLQSQAPQAGQRALLLPSSEQDCLHKALVALYSGAPLPGLVLCCSHSTSADNLRDFLLRAKLTR